MSFFGHKKRSDGVYAIVDVLPGSVAVALVRSTTRAAPLSAEYCQRLTVPLQERTPEAIITATINAFSTLTQHMRDAYLSKTESPRILRTYVIVHAPWMQSETAHATRTFDKETRITAQTLRALTKHMREERSSAHADGSVCEASVVKISLNGYPTDAPEGKSAHLLEVDALFSSCAPAVLNSIVETARVALSPDVVVRSAERVLLSIFSRSIFSPEEALVVDVGIECTSVLVVRQGVTRARMILPEGLRALVHRFDPAGVPEETLSTLRMMSRAECATPACDKLSQSLAKAEPELARVFGSAFTQLTARERVPTDFILNAPPEVQKWLDSFFGRIDFAPFTVTTLPFSVHTLSSHDFSPVITAVQGVELDAGIMFASPLVHSETLDS